MRQQGWRKRRRPPAPTRTDALLASAEFEPLLRRLEIILDTERACPLTVIDRAVLEQTIITAIAVYDGTQFLAELASRSTLHQIREPLARVVEILKHEANYDDIFVALGAPVMLALSPNQRAVDQAIERYENTLDALDDIARALPPTPAKRGPGRQPAKDLRALVEYLADYWKQVVGRPFKQDWHRESSIGPKKPTTNAAAFVYEVVKFTDASRLGAVPKMTESIVKNRRAATSVK